MNGTIRFIGGIIATVFILPMLCLIDLWSKFSFERTCPNCGAELIERGYPRDGIQHYKCPNGCEIKE